MDDQKDSITPYSEKLFWGVYKQRFPEYRKAFHYKSQRQIIGITQQLHEQTDILTSHVRKTEGIDIACKEGCSKCCHLHVSLMTPEVFYIVDKLKKTFSSSALYFIQKSLTHSANKPTKNMLYRDRCIFLGQTSNRCTIYSFRPNACRRFFSDDYRRCEATSGCPDQNSDLLYCSGALVGAFGAAGIEEQLDLESHEMNMALSMVLQDESLFRRWLNREKNIFPVVLWENAGKNFDEVRKIIQMNFR